MKRSIISAFAGAILLASCQTTRLSHVTDDVYTDPVEEKRIAKLAAEERARKEAEQKRLQEEARLAQEAKDNANPYYKDPQLSSDDYYDYAYASRFRRFHNPVYGTGYYDDYYTNTYWYNYDPMCYGSSIYGSYNWYMPSSYFNVGVNYGYPYSYGWNNPYSFGTGFAMGYNQGYYNGYYGYPYYNSFYSPYNGYPNYGNWYQPYQWGYFNAFDNNSNYKHYGPRGNISGGNSAMRTNAGMNMPDLQEKTQRESFFGTMAEKQNATPRFSNTVRPIRTQQLDPNSQPGNNHEPNGIIRQPNDNPNSNPVRGNGSRIERNDKEPGNSNPRNNRNTIEMNKTEKNPMEIEHNQSQRSNPGNQGGGNTSPAPRNNGGGNSRPR